MALPTQFRSPTPTPIAISPSSSGNAGAPNYTALSQNAGPTAKPVLQQAANVQQKQVQYNPKLDPKYNANSGAGAPSSSVDPRSCAGQSLVGKDLQSITGAGGSSSSAGNKSAGGMM